MALPDQIRDESTRYGVYVIGTGLVLFIALRWWTSPIVRTITDQGTPGMVEFLLIPAFLAVLTVGVVLFVWEPDQDR